MSAEEANLCLSFVGSDFSWKDETNDLLSLIDTSLSCVMYVDMQTVKLNVSDLSKVDTAKRKAIVSLFMSVCIVIVNKPFHNDQCIMLFKDFIVNLLHIFGIESF